MTYLPYAYMSIQEFVLHQTVPTFSKICGVRLSFVDIAMLSFSALVDVILLRSKYDTRR